MKTKLTHLFTASLILLSVVFSAINSAQAQLATPGNLVATALKNGEIQLEWVLDEMSQGETGFEIIADTDSSFTNQPRRRRIRGGDTTTFTTPRFQGATTYWFSVRALGPSGNSDWSPASAPTTTPPDDLHAVYDVVNNQINLTWVANPQNNNISGYTFRYSRDCTFDSADDDWVGNVNNFTVMTEPSSAAPLSPNTTYYFEIKVDNSDNAFDSPYSESVHATTSAPQALSVGPPISDVFFGLNAWMPYQIGDCADYPENCPYYGHLEETLCGADWNYPDTCNPGIIQDSGAQIMRYGGIGVDVRYSDSLSPGQYKTMVENIQSNGMEPIIQVPYNDGAHDTSVAADLVTSLNITHGLAVKYWTIGNEPDHYTANNYAYEIATYFRSFASAMKSVDPSILITGPDLSFYDESIMEELTDPGGANDITGTFTGNDGLEHYYLDIINFHRYPFGGESDQTRSAVIAYPACGLQDNLIALKSRVDAANAHHGRTGLDALKMGITEINVNYLNPQFDGIDGVGATSFLGGQYWAEVFSLGMKYGLAFITPWSVVEGNELGFINHDFGTKHPSYYHFQMMATNFRGNYLEAAVLNLGLNDPLIKAFGAKDNDQIVVMILNQHECGTNIGAVDYTVRLDGGTVGGNNPLKINLGAGVNSEYSNPNGQPLQCESTVLLVFDDQGNLLRRKVYNKEWHAYQDLPPSEETY